MSVVRFLAGVATAISNIAIAISPVLFGALWLYASVAVWRDFGPLGLAAWDVPTLALTLYLPWAGYRSARSMVEISGLSEEEQIEYYQRPGLFPMGLSFILGLVAFQFQTLAQRSVFLKVLLWVSLTMFSIEAALIALCSWIATAMVLGAYLGVVGIVVGILTPMLLVFHWLGERDKLLKAHPECVGGT